MIMNLLLFYLTWFDIFFIFKVFTPWNHSLISMLLTTKIRGKIIFKGFVVLTCPNRWLQILSLILCERFTGKNRLFLEERQIFKLSPYKIGLFNLISNSKPNSSWYYSFHHARIISSSYVGLQSVLVFNWCLNEGFIWKIYFPKKISVVVGLIRRLELFLVSFYIFFHNLFLISLWDQNTLFFLFDLIKSNGHQIFLSLFFEIKRLTFPLLQYALFFNLFLLRL